MLPKKGEKYLHHSQKRVRSVLTCAQHAPYLGSKWPRYTFFGNCRCIYRLLHTYFEVYVFFCFLLVCLPKLMMVHRVLLLQQYLLGDTISTGQLPPVICHPYPISFLHATADPLKLGSRFLQTL